MKRGSLKLSDVARERLTAHRSTVSPEELAEDEALRAKGCIVIRGGGFHVVMDLSEARRPPASQAEAASQSEIP